MPICSLLQLSAPPDKSEKLPTKAVGAIHTTGREIRKRHGRVMEAVWNDESECLLSMV